MRRVHSTLTVKIAWTFFSLFVLSLIPSALADISASVVVPSGGQLDLDAGIVKPATALDGDLYWSSTTGFPPAGNITLLHHAYIVPGRGLDFFNSLTPQTLAGYQYSSSGLISLIAQGSGNASVFALITKCGNYAKVLITSIDNNLGVQFTTYIPNGGGACPNISEIHNNYTPGALLQGGVAPGGLFLIKGYNLNNSPLTSLQTSAAPGLPTILNGTTLSVTVNGVTTKPGLYYTSPGQIGAVLPSNTPTGLGTISVTNNGVPGASTPISVLPSAVGLATLDGSGAGPVIATDANYQLISPTAPARPGQAIVLWGSGVGADLSNDDRTFPLNQNNLTSLPLQVYFGTAQAAVLYHGRSQFPGVDQIVVTLPQDVLPGCLVSVAVVASGFLSNTATIPVSTDGSPCSDPILSAAQVPSLLSPPGTRYGFLRLFSSNLTFNNGATADFIKKGNTPAAVDPSLGSCLVQAIATGDVPDSRLDAGTVSVSANGGAPQPLTNSAGSYFLALPSFPVSGGFAMFTGVGGKDAGSFSATVNVLPFTMLNTDARIVRSQGHHIAWQGGDQKTYVRIDTVARNLDIRCTAPASASEFTLPGWLLSAMPASLSQPLSLDNHSIPQLLTIPGLDLASIEGESFYSFNVAYQ